MATLLDRTFTFYELGQSFDNAGNSVDGVLSQRTVKGTVQPLTGQEVVTYFAGSRNTGSVKIYSSEKLVVRSEDGTKKGFIKNENRVYELVEEMPYINMGVIAHYKYIASFVPQSQIPGALQ